MLPNALTSHSARRLKLRSLRGRVGLGLVAALSVLAGMTDAIGFMASGDFVSFMSGNTTRLAVAISDGGCGLMLRLAERYSASSSVMPWACCQPASVGVAPAGAAGASRGCCVPRRPGRCHDQLPALLAATIAMGMINAVVEQVNGLPIGLTYVTGALSRFGRGLGRWMLGERRNGWRVQLMPWTGMLLGAALGAWLEHRLGLQALAGSCALTCLLALVTRFIPRSWQLGYMPR